MRVLDRLAPPPRLVDWSILTAVLVLLATGLVSLVTGRPGGAWVFDVHAVAGLVLVALLIFKFRRVAARVTRRAWTRATVVSVLLAALSVAALATGVAWVLGASLDLGPWGLLNLHVGLGLLVLPVLLVHLRSRFRLPAAADFEDRRTALQYATLLGAGALTWRLQGVANDLLDTAGARRRFTGSREEGSGAGNRFPVTSWVADDPDPVDPEEWTLRVEGEVASPVSLTYDDLDPGTRREALLDCTSGWYSVHEWGGVRVGDLLAAADPDDDAAWVRFRSVTGYRWSLPIEEARDAVLATHVDGERLSHGHGFPMRLVAPGRRGFQWVKWVESVELTRRRDNSDWIAIFVSGL